MPLPLPTVASVGSTSLTLTRLQENSTHTVSLPAQPMSAAPRMPLPHSGSSKDRSTRVISCLASACHIQSCCGP